MAQPFNFNVVLLYLYIATPLYLCDCVETRDPGGSVCNCNWQDWGSWTSCSRSCGGGTRSRTRSLPDQSCVSSCGTSPQELKEDQPCNTFCYNGGSFIDNKCHCLDTFYGACCHYDANTYRPSHQQSHQLFLRPPAAPYNSNSEMRPRRMATQQQCFRCKDPCADSLTKDISDSSFTASSQYDPYHAPYRARLHTIGHDSAAQPWRGAWSVLTNDKNQWLKIHFLRLAQVRSITTQGRNSDTYDQWVTRYTVEYSLDGTTWKTAQTFHGNTNKDTPVTRSLGENILARYVRIRPRDWHVHESMRVDVNGCYVVCSHIPNCDKHQCSSSYDALCAKCNDQGSTIEQSVYWPDTSKKNCQRTCSWKSQWCWPGKCNNSLPSSCVCEKGFSKITATTTCDLSTKADLLTCKMSVGDPRGEIRQTNSGTSSTSCSSETDVFINIKPTSLSFHLASSFTREGSTTEPIYIPHDGTKLGIVEGKATLSKLDTAGHSSTLPGVSLQGGGSCNSPLSSTTPSVLLDCKKNISFTSNILNGQRICAKLSVSSGGSFTLLDYNGKKQNTKPFTPVEESKTLCFKYDDAPPVHCSATSSCKTEPLHLSSRLTRSSNITVHVSGWSDPPPLHGRPDQASGIDFYLLEVFKMTHLNKILTVDRTASVFNSHNLKGPDVDIHVNLPDQPSMYAVYLEVHDVAGNVGYARRLLFYDNSSAIKVMDNEELRVVSASKDSNFKWQIHHGNIQLAWKDHFHNNYSFSHDYMAPVKPDTDNKIVGKYEQNTGDLPVNGTINVNGVTDFKFKWTLNNVSMTTWSPVPDFINQSLSLDLNLKDGQTYEVWIKSQDIMQNEFEESVVVHIDRSVASIADTWLVREGTSQIYVHNNTDLSTMVLQFHAFDVHSGIISVQWALGTKNGKSDLGSGALPVKKDEDCPPEDKLSCYCPSVGRCEYKNYTLTLNSLRINNTDTGQHNREYYFTVYITNGAMLKSFDHLDVLVDESHPEVGVVQEGAAGGPDIDYTSEDHVLVSWKGFIDHESGINQYLVGFATQCLTAEELTWGNSTKFKTEHTEFETYSFTFPKKGRYFTSVVALNNALEPSPVVCSDGITFDTSAPVAENIHLHQATATPSLHCIDSKVWLINKNLTMTLLPETQGCLDRCSLNYNDNNLRFEIVYGAYINNETADSVCREFSYFNNTITFIPFDKLILNWSISETDSQIRDSFIGIGSDISRINTPDLMDYEPAHGKTDFRLHRTGFGGSTEFYIFLKVENKAGLSSLATLGPVMIDDTPPIVHGVLKPEVNGDHVRVTWNKGTFSDPEQADSQFTVTYRAVMEEKYVTPILETSQTLRMACQSAGFTDCIQYPLHNLQLQDSELGKPCLFELYVYNSAGHFTTVRTESLLLPSRFPPGPATIIDLDPEAMDELVDVDFHKNNTVCIHWFGFHHHRNITLEICVGTAKGLDDVIQFQGFQITKSFTTCIESPVLKPFTRYFTSVRANCSGGSSVSSSDGFVIVVDVASSLSVHDGSGCEPHKKYLIKEAKLITVPSRENTFSFNYTLNIDVSYTLTIENATSVDKMHVLTNDTFAQVIVKAKSSDSITFNPLKHNPVFRIIYPFDSNLIITLYNCVEDMDYQSSTATYTMNWRAAEPYRRFLTHYDLTLQENTCKNGCPQTVQKARVIVSEDRAYKFVNLHLHSNVEYIGSVTPCFERVCLSPVGSNGVQVARKPIIEDLTSKLEDETTVCTNVSLEMSGIECGETSFNMDSKHVIQWALMRSHSDVSPLTNWERLDVTSLDQKMFICPKLPVHSYQAMFSCVRVFCPSGLFDKKCVELILNPHAESYNDHVLFELPADDKRLENVEDLLHSQHLGTRLKTLHEMELDFVNSSSRISAVITNSAGYNITWYMMKGKREIPIKDCDLDASCSANKTSQNGHIRFGRIMFDRSESYYVCAEALSLDDKTKFTVCGNGFIMDDSPPIAGSVSVTNAVAGFLTDASHMYITWSGFKDVLPYQGSRYAHGIKAFSLGIGNYPRGNNIQAWTRVGDSTSYVATGIQIKNGEEYFVTIKAEDHVGHVTESVSPGVVADLTPPLCGDIRVEGLLPHKNMIAATSLHIHLKDFQDPESSIHSLHLSVSVLTSTNTDSVHLDVEPGTDFVKIMVDDAFVDGHRYQIELQVTNNAGLHSTCFSRSFILDNSPPQAGVVREGRQDSQDEHDHQTDTTRIECHWSGFTDPHSGIQDYRVGLGTSSDTLDVHPLLSVGLKTNYTWIGTFLPGVNYYSTVEVCNGAGLCTTTSSDGITMDGSPPVAGLVIVGHSDTHHKHHGHRSYVYSHWVGFEDAETEIHHFECCIGRHKYSCDIVNFTNTALSDSYMATGLKLPLSVPLYVTVRAYNPVGMFVEATSPSFTVDDTSPLIINQPVFISTTDGTHNITAQWDNSLLYVTWKFSDDESPIHEHVLTFRTHHESAVAIETVKLGPQQSYLLVLGEENRLQNGDRYQVSVSSCNRAGLCTTSHSPDILIDSTPPLLGGFKPPLNWGTTVMNGSMINNVTLTWYGYSDSESTISHYQISVGRTYEGAELTKGTVEVKHDTTVQDQSVTLQLSELLSEGENIVLSILAENILGLKSLIGKVSVTVIDTNHLKGKSGILEIQRHSCDVHYCTDDCTCSVVGQKCTRLNNDVNCTDISHSTSLPDVTVYAGTSQQSGLSVISSLSCLAGHWNVRRNLSVEIRRYEYSMGIKGQQPIGGVFEELDFWYDVGKQTETIYCLPYDCALEHNRDYVIYVKAWYSETDYSVFTSDSIKVDRTPPAVGKGKAIMESDATCQKDFDIFPINQTAVFACWKSLFQETQSGIKEYLVWAGVTKYGTDLLPVQSVGLHTNIPLPVEDIIPGTKYYVGVRAVNTLNMSTTVISDGFLLDADQPLGGHVFNSENNKNKLAQSETSFIGVSWNGFQDHDSGVRHYLVQIFDDRMTEVIADVNVTLSNSLRVEDLHLEHGERYIVSVAAEDFAGHIGEAVFSQPVLIDITPPTGFVCQEFREVSPVNISFDVVKVASYVINHFYINLPVNENTNFRVRISIPADQLDNDIAIFSVGKLYARTPFAIQGDRSMYTAEYQFTFESDGSIANRLEIIAETKSSIKDAHILVESCIEKRTTAGPDAITVKQMMPSVLSICTRVMDSESGLKNIHIGVGTTRDGYQLQTLRPTVARFHELLEVDVPHGTPVYTTVIAENHAGLKSYFLSDPTTVDHTPPVVTDLKTNLKYMYNVTRGSLDVLVQASWLVEEKESTLAFCWCSVGHKSLSSDVQDWVLSANSTSCQVPVSSVTHGLRLYLTVQCSNTVKLNAVVSSEEHQVLLRPPSSSGSSVDIVVQNRYSKHDEKMIQSSTSSLKFQWTWPENEGVSHYQCRAGGIGIREWVNASLRYCELSGHRMSDGERYTVEVRTVDERGQTSDWTTAEVTVDSTKPKLTGSRAVVKWEETGITLSYGSVFQHLSEQLTYTISVGSNHGYSDYLHQLVTRQNVVTVKLPATSEIHVTIRAEAQVGTSAIYNDVFSTRVK